MNCINCPFHKIIPDPDPTDWFNADDEAILCLKVSKDPNPKSQYQVRLSSCCNINFSNIKR